jgi:SAM-dependent methyltransferase
MHRAVATATAAIAEDLTRHHNASTESLLDFGGGLGFYADGFSRHFEQVTLYDVDAKACAYARDAFPGRFKIIEGQPDQPVPTDQRYDVVFASHVVEHYVDLPAFFSALRTLAKPGGIIVVATPNNSTWEYLARTNLLLHYVKRTVGRRISRLPQACAALLSNSWLCCDPPRHIYALNSSSIRAIAEDSGLVVQTVFTEYAWNSRYARVNDQVPQFGHGLVKRVLQSTMNLYARLTLLLLRSLDSRQTKGGNLVLIARAP